MSVSRAEKGNLKEQRLVTAVIVGLGERGTKYASYALDFPDKLKVVAVAEPRKVSRERLKRWFFLPEDKLYTNCKSLVAAGKLADCAIIATCDSMHKDQAVELAGLGYHLLLEKPMAVSLEDCTLVTKACQQADVMLAVCHVLRYFAPVQTIHQLIENGTIGDVVHIQHTENIGFWHFAHSFVRGNWSNTSESTFSLLAKCCHDVDLIHYWMRKKCCKVTSVGSLYHFRKEKQPKNASDNCLGCSVEKVCPYSAKKVYLDPIEDLKGPAEYLWPMSVVADRENMTWDEYRSTLRQALQSGPYGRCVYSCSNDVCDNQVVNFEFEDGSTATLTMIAFTEQLCERETKIFGSHGTIAWSGKAEGPVCHYDFLTKTSRKLIPKIYPTTNRLSGHGGADFWLMNSFVKAVAFNDPSYIKSGAEDSLCSHRLVFAAEEHRLTGRTTPFN